MACYVTRNLSNRVLQAKTTDQRTAHLSITPAGNNNNNNNQIIYRRYDGDTAAVGTKPK